MVWSEGSIERDLSVTQYITNPQQGGFLAEDESAAAGAGGASGSSPSGAPGAGGGRSRR